MPNGALTDGKSRELACEIRTANACKKLFSVFVGVAETQIFKQDKSKAPGDTAPAGWKRYSDPAERDAKLTSELKNGRLAMMAIMGQMVQQMIWGTAPVADFLKGHYTPF